MPRRPSLVKTSESPEPRITSTSAKEVAPPPERSDASRQFDQTRRWQLIKSRLGFWIRLLGRINPRFAVAVVSCVLFAGLLVRVSQVAQHQTLPPSESTVQLTAMVPPAEPPKQSDETKQAIEVTSAPAVAAVRMIDAPSAISQSCREQAWPYVTGDCLTQVDQQIRAEMNTDTDAADHVVPAVLVDVSHAEAKMSPEDSLSVVIDKPRRARSASKRRHRHEVHAERRRRAPRSMASGDVAFGTPSFQPLEANNMP